MPYIREADHYPAIGSFKAASGNALKHFLACEACVAKRRAARVGTMVWLSVMVVSFSELGDSEPVVCSFHFRCSAL
jgi:hypothetical protein